MVCVIWCRFPDAPYCVDFGDLGFYCLIMVGIIQCFIGFGACRGLVCAACDLLSRWVGLFMVLAGYGFLGLHIL